MTKALNGEMAMAATGGCERRNGERNENRKQLISLWQHGNNRQWLSIENN
jgi:hypothetical protein